MTDLIFHPLCSSLSIPGLQRQGTPSAERIRAQITDDGYLVRFSQNGSELPCAYTVGLTELGLPELILYGQSLGHVHQAWALLQPALHHLTHPGARVFHGQFDGQTVQVRRESLRRLRDAHLIYGQEGFAALQVYWMVGSDNHLPQQWEIRFLAAQPFLADGSLGDLVRQREAS